MPTSRPVVISIAALVVALTAFLLPSVDARLPGGAIMWQLAALAVAAGGAVWGWRAARAGTGVAAPQRRWGRILGVVALLLVVAWIAGVAFLWVIWPR